MPFCPAAYFSKLTFSKKYFRSKSLDLEQAQHFVGPDLGPNCLQRARDNSRHES